MMSSLDTEQQSSAAQSAANCLSQVSQIRHLLRAPKESKKVGWPHRRVCSQD